MISKQTFCEVMYDIIAKEEKMEELRKANPSLALAILDYSLLDSLIKTLEDSFGLPVNQHFGTTISWWVYETNCGKGNCSIYLTVKNRSTTRKKEIRLDTPEKLYDYCCREVGYV